MPSRHDGPASPRFQCLPFEGNTSFETIGQAPVSETLRGVAGRAPSGACTGWGIPFEVRRPLLVTEEFVELELDPVKAQWLVFLHTADVTPQETDEHGFISPTRGMGRLGERIADYVLVYADGSEARHAIRRRHQIGMIQRPWGEHSFEAVAMRKPQPFAPAHEQPSGIWGFSQTRAGYRDNEAWCSYLWAWENPHPRKAIAGLRVEPAGSWPIVLSAISAGNASSHPLRWERRRKALLKLPKGEAFDSQLEGPGLLKQIQLDLGQVISAQRSLVYPNDTWAKTYDRQLAAIASDQILIEYSAHSDARFHLTGGRTVPVAKLAKGHGTNGLKPVAPSTRRVSLRVVDKVSKQPIPVKLHVHGESGEYLAPVDRHRIPNPSWFEDYSSDFVGFDPLTGGVHYATYIPGETTIDLPLGVVYLEVSKGFEIDPVRKLLKVTPATRSLTVALEKVLPWRERGWVTADTHVHFLSPKTAELEGSAEGVNVINLLASQWGELMTNVGDFDGKTTFGSREAGGEGEWLVRVGTENRQHVLGHISLLGYSGDPISPMCAGGPDEAAIGDPVDVLMTEWARQCRAQGGLAVFPHFPAPRAENAAALVHGDVDAIEMCSIGNEYTGIDPYSLSDWYRYLNCGYFYPAVGGTDKMAATTAVGTIRTYARIPAESEFTYASWMDAVRSGDTFVTYGPLLELRVEGRPPGAVIKLPAGGGRVEVEYELASVTLPMTRVDLVVNGEIRESKSIGAKQSRGHWSVALERSSWLALLVRGKRPDRAEVIGAHSSPVRALVGDSAFFSAADALTILEQIEGAIAYFETLGTRADDKARKRMRLVLTSAHRKLHNQMHQNGYDHRHTHAHDHASHRGKG